MDRTPATLSSAFPLFDFCLLDGHAQLAVAEAVECAAPRPVKVTAIIAASFAQSEDGVPRAMDPDTARRITAAGREWLLQRAALHFNDCPEWFEAPCLACGARFDLKLSIVDIPRSGPGPGFPVTEVQTSLGKRYFEAPNGTHEEAIARSPDSDPRRLIAARCGLFEKAESEAGQFTNRDLDSIETALEAISPDIADSVDIKCPECGHAARPRIDPLAFAFPRLVDVLQEVHLVARTYHWPEREILNLPLTRRRAYADLITRDSRSGRQRGVH
jgi:hypothetical protein